MRAPLELSGWELRRLFGEHEQGNEAVAAREPNAILRRQVQISRDVTAALRRCPGRGLSRDPLAMHLLSQMLSVNPATRIHAAEALEHPFLQSAAAGNVQGEDMLLAGAAGARRK